MKNGGEFYSVVNVMRVRNAGKWKLRKEMIPHVRDESTLVHCHFLSQLSPF